PLRIGLGHVAVERAVLAFVGNEIERQRRGHQPFGRRRDKIAEPRLTDHRAEHLGIILAEGGWCVHGGRSLEVALAYTWQLQDAHAGVAYLTSAYTYET